MEKIVTDKEIGKGLGITNRWNGNGVQKLALESIAKIGGEEAIKSLKGIVSNGSVSGELETLASRLLEALVFYGENKRGR